MNGILNKNKVIKPPVQKVTSLKVSASKLTKTDKPKLPSSKHGSGNMTVMTHHSSAAIKHTVSTGSAKNIKVVDFTAG